MGRISAATTLYLGSARYIKVEVGSSEWEILGDHVEGESCTIPADRQRPDRDIINPYLRDVARGSNSLPYSWPSIWLMLVDARFVVRVVRAVLLRAVVELCKLHSPAQQDR